MHLLGTSNVLAGYIVPGLIPKGTHAHSYVMSYQSLDEIINTTLYYNDERTEFKSKVLEKRKLLPFSEGNNGELAAFISYAQAFPTTFMALVDTYDTIRRWVILFSTILR